MAEPIKQTITDEGRDLAAVLNLPEGQRFLFRILEHCGIYRTTFDEASGSVSAVAEGKRSVGLFIRAAMDDVSPLLYPTLALSRARELYLSQPVEPQDDENDGEQN